MLWYVNFFLVWNDMWILSKRKLKRCFTFWVAIERYHSPVCNCRLTFGKIEQQRIWMNVEPSTMKRTKCVCMLWIRRIQSPLPVNWKMRMYAFFFFLVKCVCMLLNTFRVIPDWAYLATWKANWALWPLGKTTRPEGIWNSRSSNPKKTRQNVIPRHDSCLCHNCCVLSPYDHPYKGTHQHARSKEIVL